MTRRGERLTGVTLRLVLLLGGVALAWGAYELATADAAQAAGRPSPGSAAAHRFSHVPGPPHGAHRHALGPTRHTASTCHHCPAGAPPRRSAPQRPGHATGTSAPRHRPSHRPARQQPADHRPAAAARPAPPAAVDPPRPAPRPAYAVPARHPTDVGPPVAGPLRPGPVDAPVPAPGGEVLRPVPEPVGIDLLPPVAGALRPATRPLGPVLSPVWDGLEPVLDPVLRPGKPVKDDPGKPAEDDPGKPVKDDPGKPAEDDPGKPVKDDPGKPAEDDPGKPTERAIPPAVPAQAADPVGPATEIRPVAVEDTDRISRAGRGHPASLRMQWSFTPLGLALRSGQPAHPAPFPSDIAADFGTQAPGTTGSGSAGSGHSDLAEVTAGGWAPPAQSGRPCRDCGDHARPSRSPRPGTRPA